MISGGWWSEAAVLSTIISYRANERCVCGGKIN